MSESIGSAKTLVCEFPTQVTNWLNGRAEPIVTALEQLQAAHPQLRSTIMVQVRIEGPQPHGAYYEQEVGLQWSYEHDGWVPVHNHSNQGNLPAAADPSLSVALSHYELEQQIVRRAEERAISELESLVGTLPAEELAERRKTLASEFQQEYQESMPWRLQGAPGAFSAV